MKEFKATYLYIKRHSITGLLYFGKSARTEKQMLKYTGSGRPYWANHLKKHGKEHVETVWYCLFTEEEECKKFALQFSEQQNIVESKEWVNLKLENGLEGGGIKGIKFINRKSRGPDTEEMKAKKSSKVNGKLRSEEDKKKCVMLNAVV